MRTPYVHHDHALAMMPFAEEDEPTIAAILAALRQLEGAEWDHAGPGPEELADLMEEHPFADRAAMVNYFAYRPSRSPALNQV